MTTPTQNHKRKINFKTAFKKPALSIVAANYPYSKNHGQFCYFAKSLMTILKTTLMI